MKKVLSAFCLTIISSVLVLAQSSDYKRSEFSVGYSNQQVDTGANSNSGNAARDFFNDRLSFNGFEASGVYNVSRYFGVKGDFSGAYRNRDFNFSNGSGTTSTTTNFGTKNSLYNVLGGVQVKDNATETRFKPFAHALVGVGHARTKVENFTTTAVGSTTFANSFSDTGLAAALGGGLDIKVNDKIDFRALQVDYNPIRLNGAYEHNVRFGIGVVFH